MLSRLEKINVKIHGHLKILEYRTVEDYENQTNFTVLLDQTNAVHRENASILIARALTDRPDGTIHDMYFGNGGATIDPLGNVILNPPNVMGAADLYSPTYFENVDDRQGAPEGNRIDLKHISGTVFATIEIRCVIGKNEPFTDQTITPFVFNEIGLKTEDHLLITHLTFAPVTKDPIRIVEVIYSLIVAIGGTAPPTYLRLIGVEATAAVGGLIVS